jgi:hypothetical protein
MGKRPTFRTNPLAERAQLIGTSLDIYKASLDVKILGLETKTPSLKDRDIRRIIETAIYIY